MVAMVKAIVGR